jgi:dihydroorotase
LVTRGRIELIDENISPRNNEIKIIDATSQYLLPGLIDDQVHFREPGLTHKGNLYSESLAAVAGGITSYIEQPNTVPQATTIELLEEKFALAASKSLANYSFNLGATNSNIEELKRADKSKHAGIKIFMGSSTGNMLVDNHAVLEDIFTNVDHQLIVHCEDESTIKANLEKFREEFGDNISPGHHPLIRSEEACYLSSSFAVELARKHDSKLHVYHLSTGKETGLFSNKVPLEKKRITAEVCVHHLWFTSADYEKLGNFIKWNPAIKTEADRNELWEALLDDRIDVIATDHAPHTLEEKKNPYLTAPSGGPLVQHALVSMMEFVHREVISIEKLVQKMCHNPAILFGIKERGFIREGYHADLVLVDPHRPWNVNENNILYHCGWSPFIGQQFKSRVTHTFVNGHLVYRNGDIDDSIKGSRLEFERN